MQSNTSDTVNETKRLIQWIGGNLSDWDMVCGNNDQQDMFFDYMEIIKRLKENQFYPQILALICTHRCGIQEIAINAVIEEILEICDKDWIDRVSDRIIFKLN